MLGQLGRDGCAGNSSVQPAVTVAAAAWQVDPVAWKLEVERVAPKLRVAVAPDMRDWRQHLEAAHTHMGTLQAAWPDVRCGHPPAWDWD